MSTTLMRVELRYVVYVMAESARRAAAIAEDNVRDERPVSSPVSKATVVSVVADGWAGALPYGDADDGEERSCAMRAREQDETGGSKP